jgi:EAL domain-containing protein (putative c-di-GMP-specific phosphodiesterase class I)
VETAEQLRLVQEVGIPVAQGYLLGRPAATLDFSDIDIAGLRHEGEFAAALAAR